MRGSKKIDGYEGFVQAVRICKGNEDLWSFLLYRPNSHALFALMAHRARRAPGIDKKSGTFLEAGECFLGAQDAKVNLNLSDQQYRTAKKQLEESRLATFKATKRGTIGKITNSLIYNINEVGGNGVDSKDENRPPIDPPQGSRRPPTTNKNVNKDNKEKECEEPSSEQNPESSDQSQNRGQGGAHEQPADADDETYADPYPGQLGGGTRIPSWMSHTQH
ncbi:MAG: hypothetical protein RBR06_01855 [Desulfuromonadaceae bacterium]|nr:hypothetical protein [Desulfuromonadaceae bacterium]